MDYLVMTLLGLTGVFMMFIILLQRGRGGGLAGAFGGAGGQSAFGTKAGDVFTKITIGIAVVWVVLAGLSGFALRAGANRRADEGFAPKNPTVESAEKDDAPIREAPAESDEAQPTGIKTSEPDNSQEKTEKVEKPAESDDPPADQNKDQPDEKSDKASEDQTEKPKSDESKDDDK